MIGETNSGSGSICAGINTNYLTRTLTDRFTIRTGIRVGGRELVEHCERTSFVQESPVNQINTYEI